MCRQELFQYSDLGLYIVNEIVRGHGGTVRATSDHTGTEFRIVLPMDSN